MKVLITGKGGQLSEELLQTVPAGCQVTCLGVSELDITDAGAVTRTFAEVAPDLVINAAAYTAVDKAEADAEAAWAVNAAGAGNLATACRAGGVRMLHVSTDFVFDGTRSTPYETDAEPRPVSVYGASKLAGETAVTKLLPTTSLIVRTAWVYSVRGNNFVKTMLRLMAEKPEMAIVYDQIGTPTWAKGLARWLWAVSSRPEVEGIYHWTDAGVASWYDFAVAIQELGLQKGLLNREIPLRPIPCSAYPTPARRPSYSVISKASAEAVAGMQTIHWRKQLSMMLDELVATGQD